MSNFKIGDTIHYMECNAPKQSVIKGIVEIQGFVETSGLKKDVKEGKSVLYSTGSYFLIEEDLAFQTSEKLMNSLFNPKQA